MTSEYVPREEHANVRRIGEWAEPNPEAYLGTNALRNEAMKNHPSNGTKPLKEKRQRTAMEPDEVVNAFRLLLLFFGAVCSGVGVGLWLLPAVGLFVFGAMIWVMGAWFIGTSKISNDDK